MALRSKSNKDKLLAAYKFELMPLHERCLLMIEYINKDTCIARAIIQIKMSMFSPGPEGVTQEFF